MSSVDLPIHDSSAMKSLGADIHLIRFQIKTGKKIYAQLTEADCAGKTASLVFRAKDQPFPGMEQIPSSFDFTVKESADSKEIKVYSWSSKKVQNLENITKVLINYFIPVQGPIAESGNQEPYNIWVRL